MAVGIAFYDGMDKGNDWVRRLIRHVTGGPYTHCCVVWSDGKAVEACGRDRTTPWVKWRERPTGPGWVTFWFRTDSSGDHEALSRALRVLYRPFNYSRVYLGLAVGLLPGRIGRRIWDRFAPRVWPRDALDCVQLVQAVVGGLGMPRAESPNELYRRLLPMATIYVKTGGNHCY